MPQLLNLENRLRADDRAAHDWYRFVLSFPPHLVRDYLERCGIAPGDAVLDPFCGTGTTLVECKKLGIASAGIEGNPMARLASAVKTDWAVSPKTLRAAAEAIAVSAEKALRHAGTALRTLPLEQEKLLLAGSICPLPLHKVLVLRDAIAELAPPRLRNHLNLALARVAVANASNLHFGPEVGVRGSKNDAEVIAPWLEAVDQMAKDVAALASQKKIEARVIAGDARSVGGLLEPRSVDFVFTSPPYPNEKDYTRATRLESVLLGWIRDPQELRALKKTLMRSNTRNVYKGDAEDRWVRDHPEIQRIAAEIEARRIELGKTSGFEKLYARVTTLYFGGMAQHLRELRPILRPGAKLAYVVGDQASFFRVMIRTGQLLADIAEPLGYKVLGIDLFRTRRATATKADLREEVVVLEWRGV